MAHSILVLPGRQSEKQVATYVIREHKRGRSRTTSSATPAWNAAAAGGRPSAPRRRVIRELGDDIAAARSKARRPARLAQAAADAAPRALDRDGADRQVPRGDPVRLEDDDVVVGLPSLDLTSDDFGELVHLEPVEHPLLDGLDQVARLDPRVVDRVTADEGCALEDGETELFLIFGDRTNGTTTYGAGRFLYAARPGPDGIAVVDFNKAYNPPCAFTPFATCPLPPPPTGCRVDWTSSIAGSAARMARTISACIPAPIRRTRRACAPGTSRPPLAAPVRYWPSRSASTIASV